MEIAHVRRLLTGAGLAGAVLAGWHIAHGDLLGVAVIAAALFLWLAGGLAGLPADVLVMGVVLVGYLVGNRGFAQLHPPSLPLLPGEFVLALSLVVGGWRAVRRKTLQIRRDALNLFVLCWIVLGAARMPLDLRTDGVMALRDFAFVYYALFFFLAQGWAELPATGRWLIPCLTWGLALAAPAFAAFLLFPDWLTAHLVVAGTPLIFVKNDVAGGFVAGGTLWFVHRYVCTRRPGWLVLAAGALAGVGVSNNRGAVVALLGAVLVLLVLRAWSLLRVLAALGALGLVGLGTQAILSKQPVTASPIYRLYESMASIGDLQGNRTYQASNLDDKPDNNQFRLVWWRAVVEETASDGFWFGLGFGHDIAAEFLRIYYADDNAEFTVRSPHNFLLSVFSRMGVTGFVLFGGIVVLMGRQTWRSRETVGDPESPLPLWLLNWTILGSACFGVVLEGPMGAIVFWTALGLANARTTAAGKAPAETGPGMAAAEIAAPA